MIEPQSWLKRKMYWIRVVKNELQRKIFCNTDSVLKVKDSMYVFKINNYNQTKFIMHAIHQLKVPISNCIRSNTHFLSIHLFNGYCKRLGTISITHICCWRFCLLCQVLVFIFFCCKYSHYSEDNQKTLSIFNLFHIL